MSMLKLFIQLLGVHNGVARHMQKPFVYMYTICSSKGIIMPLEVLYTWKIFVESFKRKTYALNRFL